MDRIVASFRRQGEACAALGSPLWARLCAVAADDAEDGGAVARAVEAWSGGDPMEQALPLRVLGTAHRLALLGRAPDLADHLPSCGGEPGSRLEGAFLATVAGHLPEFRRDTLRPVQTNEVGRSAVLRAGLGVIAEEMGLPIRLFEIGAAAGLNLRLDRFGYRLGGLEVPGGPPVLAPEWTGPRPPAAPVAVAERTGCDLHPIDVATAEGAARAESFVWPDMTWRFDRMAAAVEIARAVPAELVAARAIDWLDERLHAEPGTVTVLMHSVMWQYMPPTEQVAIEHLLAARGHDSTAEAPIAHLRFEPVLESDRRWRFELRLTTWPGGEERVLARAHPHAEWVRWLD